MQWKSFTEMWGFSGFKYWCFKLIKSIHTNKTQLQIVLYSIRIIFFFKQNFSLIIVRSYSEQ
jgi:hypothetical protein